MPVNIRNNIYSDIAEQFPAFYREDGQFLVSFIEAYYKHLDEKMDRNVPKLRDIDTTLQSFLVFFKKKYLADLPIDTTTDVRFIIKHIKDMYTRKGTQESLELLFRIFFDQDIEVFYPSTAILRPSDSIWGGDAYLEMKTVFQVDDYPIEKGDRIKGDLSQATAFVDEVIFVNFSGSLSPIIYLSNITGEFSADDGIIVVNKNSVNVGKLISGSLSEVNVSSLNRVANQSVGDKVKIQSRLTGTDATGRVLKTSQQETGSIDFQIIDEGFGYLDPASTVTAQNKIGISNQVLIVETSTPVNLKPGDIVSAWGTPLSYTGSDQPDAVQYALTGSAKVIAYNHPLLYIESDNIEQLNRKLLEWYEPNNGLLLLHAVYAPFVFDLNVSFPQGSRALEVYNKAKPGNTYRDESTWIFDIDESGDTTLAANLDVGHITDINIAMQSANSGVPEVIYSGFNAQQQADVLGAYRGLSPTAPSSYKDIYENVWQFHEHLFDIYHPFVTTVVAAQNESITDNVGFNVGGYIGDTVVYPEQLPAVNFTLKINNDSSDTVTITGVGKVNDSAQFTVGGISNKETVTLITDQIGDFENVVLDADGNPSNDDYGMSGPDAENLNTSIADAFTPITVTIGSLESLDVSSAGENYQNDSFANLTFDPIARFEKRDFILNFDVVDFNLTVGEFITQERTIPDIEVGLTGNLDESEIESLGVSSSNGAVGYQDSVTTFDYIPGGTLAYTAKAKFLKRDGADFYFRPMSFHGLDETRDLNGVVTNKVLVGGVLKSFTGLREDTSSRVMGDNAQVQGIASYQTGQIDEISIVKTGYRYEDGETVDIINVEPNSYSYNQKVAEADIRVLGQGKTEGRWRSKTSFLSEESKKLHDNDYYQEYSYDISSIVDPKKYTGLISDVVGVAGTKLFSTPLINSDNPIDIDLDVEFVYYDIQEQRLIATDGVNEYEMVTEPTYSQYPGNNASGTEYALGVVAMSSNNTIEIRRDASNIGTNNYFDYMPTVGSYVTFYGAGVLDGYRPTIPGNPGAFDPNGTTYQVKTVGAASGIVTITMNPIGDTSTTITFLDSKVLADTSNSTIAGAWVNRHDVYFHTELDSSGVGPNNQYLMADIANQTGVS